jgi:hypothetical protein
LSGSVVEHVQCGIEGDVVAHGIGMFGVFLKTLVGPVFLFVRATSVTIAEGALERVREHWGKFIGGGIVTAAGNGINAGEGANAADDSRDCQWSIVMVSHNELEDQNQFN